MTGEPGANGAPRPPADERAQGQDLLGLGERERDALLAWVGENLTVVQRSASGQRVLYWILGIGFVVGLAADVGGFLLKIAVTTEPLLVVGDLLYTLGWALWTGAVVVVFVQIYPEAKKRQYKQALDAYQAAVGRQARAGSRQAPDPATEEAVARYRELAEVNPGRYRPDLAQSLTSLGVRLSALGRLAEAQSASEEAVAMYRELAEVNPGRYRPDLAWSLGVLADSLDLLGRGGDASVARSEAAALTGDSKAAQGLRSRSA
jgi:tetratricopeptide (TPR) repeat protein